MVNLTMVENKYWSARQFIDEIRIWGRPLSAEARLKASALMMRAEPKSAYEIFDTEQTDNLTNAIAAYALSESALDGKWVLELIKKSVLSAYQGRVDALIEDVDNVNKEIEFYENYEVRRIK
jgi:hypothetical protein